MEGKSAAYDLIDSELSGPWWKSEFKRGVLLPKWEFYKKHMNENPNKPVRFSGNTLIYFYLRE